MKLHLLRIFTVVAEYMSFSRAAQALYVSQPAVSKAVRELEHQLGVPLFERGGGKLSLTEAGALLAERGRAIPVRRADRRGGSGGAPGLASRHPTHRSEHDDCYLSVAPGHRGFPDARIRTSICI